MAHQLRDKPAIGRIVLIFWEAVLFEHANQGFLKMPGKGGKQELSEYDVDVAAEYMLNISHPRLPAD